MFLNRPPPRQDKVYGDGELPPTFDARESKLVNVPRGWPLVSAVKAIRRVFHRLVHHG